tara:strand:- start:1400 stop:1600 length:201 start_codon:yes stop_codon:yes gene_type:complete
MNKEENNKTNKLTTVKTVYARLALLLLTLNFGLTTYAIVKLNDVALEQETPTPVTATKDLAGQPQE